MIFVNVMMFYLIVHPLVLLYNLYELFQNKLIYLSKIYIFLCRLKDVYFTFLYIEIASEQIAQTILLAIVNYV